MELKNQIEKLITPSELTTILGLKRSVVYRMLRSGQIPAVRVTNGQRKMSLRVRPSALAAWMRRREVGRAS